MWEEATSSISVNSGADYSNTSAQTGSNRFVTLQADGRFLLASANDQAIGVLTRNTPLDVPGRIVERGVVPIILGGTVAAGAKVGAGALGVALATATTFLGVAIRGGTIGQIVPIKLGVNI